MDQRIKQYSTQDLEKQDQIYSEPQEVDTLMSNTLRRQRHRSNRYSVGPESSLLDQRSETLSSSVRDVRRSRNLTEGHAQELRVFEELDSPEGTTTKIIYNACTSRMSLVEEKKFAVKPFDSLDNKCTAVVLYDDNKMAMKDKERTKRLSSQYKLKVHLPIGVLVVGLVGLGLVAVILVLALRGDAYQNLRHVEERAPQKSTASSNFYGVLKETQCTEECSEALYGVKKENGFILCENNIVSIKCDPGFRPDGHDVACRNMTRGFESLRCAVKICPKPEDPKNGRVICSNINVVNSTCEVQCDHGDPKGINAFALMTCQDDLNWTKPPICESPPCLSLDNSTGLMACTPSGKRCVKRCNRSSSSKLMTCQANGQWDYNAMEAMSCSPTCSLETIHGFLKSGEVDTMSLFQEVGVPQMSQVLLTCKAGFHTFGSRKLMCSQQNGQAGWTQGSCQETVFIMAGGQNATQIIDDVEVHSNSKKFSMRHSSCLPNLPKRLKWGNMGLVSDHLMVCGGQDHEEGQNQDCWLLSAEDGIWKHHKSLDRPRSQSASAVSQDETHLVIFSGFSEYLDDGETSVQAVGLGNLGNEQPLGSLTGLLQASAVTLASGDILVTGGDSMARDVFLVSSSSNYKWTPKQKMLFARSGHATARIVLGHEEKVLAVGGWDNRGEPQASAEIYSIEADIWHPLPQLPSPRVDFKLKVVNTEVSAIGGYFGPDESPKYPKPAMISWSDRTTKWGSWHQNEGQEEYARRRSGFMSTEVPLSWLKRLCQTHKESKGG